MDRLCHRMRLLGGAVAVDGVGGAPAALDGTLVLPTTSTIRGSFGTSRRGKPSAAEGFQAGREVRATPLGGLTLLPAASGHEGPERLVLPAESASVVDRELRTASGLGAGPACGIRPVSAGKRPDVRPPVVQGVLPHGPSPPLASGETHLMSTNARRGGFVSSARKRDGRAQPPAERRTISSAVATSWTTRGLNPSALQNAIDCSFGQKDLSST